MPRSDTKIVEPDYSLIDVSNELSGPVLGAYAKRNADGSLEVIFPDRPAHQRMIDNLHEGRASRLRLLQKEYS